MARVEVDELIERWNRKEISLFEAKDYITELVRVIIELQMQIAYQEGELELLSKELSTWKEEWEW